MKTVRYYRRRRVYIIIRLRLYKFFTIDYRSFIILIYFVYVSCLFIINYLLFTTEKTYAPRSYRLAVARSTGVK